MAVAHYPFKRAHLGGSWFPKHAKQGAKLVEKFLEPLAEFKGEQQTWFDWRTTRENTRDDSAESRQGTQAGPPTTFKNRFTQLYKPQSQLTAVLFLGEPVPNENQIFFYQLRCEITSCGDEFKAKFSISRRMACCGRSSLGGKVARYQSCKLRVGTAAGSQADTLGKALPNYFMG